MEKIMEAVIVAHWANGVYINSYIHDYDDLYSALVGVFGLPAVISCEMRPRRLAITLKSDSI